MLRIYLKLRAKKDFNGYYKGEYCEMTNDVIDKQYRIAFWELDMNWEIVAMELVEYKKIIDASTAEVLDATMQSEKTNADKPQKQAI